MERRMVGERKPVIEQMTNVCKTEFEPWNLKAPWAWLGVALTEKIKEILVLSSEDGVQISH